MEKQKIESFKEYLSFVNDLRDGKSEIILYRGWSNTYPLLPSIARANPKENTTEKEIEMLAEFRRQTQLSVKINLSTDWEWLVYAQHFGMKTRLLDWSSNPLTALWFACMQQQKSNADVYVYIFKADKTFLITRDDVPFDQQKTRILKPALNNERIIAQAGWFTAHKISSIKNEFITLETISGLSDKLIEVKFNGKIKEEALEQLTSSGASVPRSVSLIKSSMQGSLVSRQFPRIASVHLGFSELPQSIIFNPRRGRTLQTSTHTHDLFTGSHGLRPIDNGHFRRRGFYWHSSTDITSV